MLHNVYPSITTFVEERELLMKLERIKGDIIHAHNDPDSLIVACGSVKGNRKLVFDCHDSNFVRHNQKIRQEKMAFDCADGYNFPSDPYRDILMETFSQYTKDKPSAVTWPLCNTELLGLKPLPRVKGICYQGNIHSALPDVQLRLPYRIYTEFTAELTNRGIPFHIYPGSMYPEMRRYEDLGALLYEPVEYLKLLRNLSRYDFGLCGGQIKHRQWDLTEAPNKLFEYLVGGIPILVFNSEGCAQTVREYDIGVVAESYDEIEKIYFNNTLVEELRKKVAEKRHLFTMEQHPRGIINTVNLYKQVLGESV